jgi:hypothetical protein
MSAHRGHGYWYNEAGTGQLAMGNSMASMLEDVSFAADWFALTLWGSGYAADFSFDSLKEIDRFFDEHTCDGQAVAGGLLSEHLGQRIFALGSYVGEVIRRRHGGEWRGSDDDPMGEINLELVLPGGGVIWPVQRVMKRFRNGAEDGIYIYGAALEPGVLEG